MDDNCQFSRLHGNLDAHIALSSAVQYSGINVTGDGSTIANLCELYYCTLYLMFFAIYIYFKLLYNTGQTFHNKHEQFTEKAYADPSLLPDRYVFILTNACNLRCPFCFQEKGRQVDQMEMEDWLQVVRQIPDYARITLTGGEPLLFKDFKKLFAIIAEQFDCNGRSHICK